MGLFTGKKPRGNLPFRLAWILGYICEIACMPFKVRPPLTRLAMSVFGTNLDVNSERAKMELEWKSKVSLEQALQEIESWVKHYLP